MFSSAASAPKPKRRKRPEAVALIGQNLWSPPDEEQDGMDAGGMAARRQRLRRDSGDGFGIDVEFESRFPLDGPELSAPIPFGVSRNAVPEDPQSVFLWHPHMPRPLFHSSYFPPLPTSRSTAPLVPQDIPRRRLDPATAPDGDDGIDAMARLIDSAAGRPLETDPEDAFYQQMMASEQVDLLWPYHYPSRNVPIPAQSYDAVMRTRLDGADTTKGTVHVSFSDIADRINQKYASSPAPYISYAEQASRDRLFEGPLPNWLQTPYGTSLVSPIKYNYSEILKHGVEWTKDLEKKTEKLHEAIRQPLLTPIGRSDVKDKEGGGLRWLGKLFGGDSGSEDSVAAPKGDSDQAQGWFGNWR